MKSYIKLFAILVFAVIATSLSAQQTIFDGNYSKEDLNIHANTWQADLSNAHSRKPVSIRSSKYTYSSTLNKGRNYNALSTETMRQGNTPQNATLQNNGGNVYYHSYGRSNSVQQNVVYNAPTQVKQAALNASERTPFEDVVVTSGSMYVDRNETPNDPSVPIGSVAIPMFMLAMAYVVIKRRNY